MDGTLNCLSILIRSRPSTSNRILNAVMSFNPLKLANSPMTPRTRVLVKSMEKTTRMLLIHLIKRYAVPSPTESRGNLQALGIRKTLSRLGYRLTLNG